MEDKTPLLDTPIAEEYYRRRADELQAQWMAATDDAEIARLKRELEPLMNWLAKKERQKHE